MSLDIDLHFDIVELSIHNDNFNLIMTSLMTEHTRDKSGRQYVRPGASVPTPDTSTIYQCNI